MANPAVRHQHVSKKNYFTAQTAAMAQQGIAKKIGKRGIFIKQQLALMDNGISGVFKHVGKRAS